METVSDMFPVELTRLEGWEDYISDFEESEYGPLVGYIDAYHGLCYVSVDDLPSPEDFREVYRGEWDSFVEFAIEYVDECGFLGGSSQFISYYFDYEKFARDLSFDYLTHDAPGLKVWVYEAN